MIVVEHNDQIKTVPFSTQLKFTVNKDCAIVHSCVHSDRWI